MAHQSKLQKVVSGGQSGVDRAALDAAIQLGLPHGGWCPLGRLAEDGTIPAHYLLEQTPSVDYAQRTEWNARDSDGTLIITTGDPTGGTAYTMEMARRHGRPWLLIDYKDDLEENLKNVMCWLEENHVATLNVAGPRESTIPGAYSAALAFTSELIKNARGKTG